jgi:hypothetical protein
LLASSSNGDSRVGAAAPMSGEEASTPAPGEDDGPCDWRSVCERIFVFQESSEAKV